MIFLKQSEISYHGVLGLLLYKKFRDDRRTALYAKYSLTLYNMCHVGDLIYDNSK